MKHVSAKARILALLQNDVCWLCGDPMDPKAAGQRRASVDHVIPVERGGSDHIFNCAAAHSICNYHRHAHYPPKEAWARLDELHQALRNAGVWLEAETPVQVLLAQRSYRADAGGPPPPDRIRVSEEIAAQQASQAVGPDESQATPDTDKAASKD